MRSRWHTLRCWVGFGFVLGAVSASAASSRLQGELNIREWTGETVEQIEARYQVPADEILEDMADAFFAQTSGIPMF